MEHGHSTVNRPRSMGKHLGMHSTSGKKSRTNSGCKGGAVKRKGAY